MGAGGGGSKFPKTDKQEKNMGGFNPPNPLDPPLPIYFILYN